MCGSSKHEQNQCLHSNTMSEAETIEFLQLQIPTMVFKLQQPLHWTYHPLRIQYNLLLLQ
jgi:hypothetical protein